MKNLNITPRTLLIIIISLIVSIGAFFTTDFFSGDKILMEGIVIEKTYVPASVSNDAKGNVIVKGSSYIVAVRIPSDDIETFNVNKNEYYTINKDQLIEFETVVGGISKMFYGMDLK